MFYEVSEATLSDHFPVLVPVFIGRQEVVSDMIEKL